MPRTPRADNKFEKFKRVVEALEVDTKHQVGKRGCLDTRKHGGGMKRNRLMWEAKKDLVGSH